MNKIKDKISSMLDETVDQNTRLYCDSLTEIESQKLFADINKNINYIKGVTPVVTIKELKRDNKTLSWKLLCKTQIISSTNL